MATLTYGWPWGELASIAYGNGTALSPLWDNWAGAPSELAFTQAGGGQLTKSTVTRTGGGRITTSGTDGAGSSFTYDNAGRLTAATIPGHTMSWTYPATGGCGLAATAGKNTNRATMVDNGVTTTYCYDHADRLTSATGMTSVVYDAHGNTTTLGAATLGWDNDNRNTSITTEASTTITDRLAPL
jgi:YD repeat-containing protein